MSKQERDKGKCVGHTGHDKCGSSDGVAIYEHDDGSQDGYCWVCGEYVKLEGSTPAWSPKTNRAHSRSVFWHIRDNMPIVEIPHRRIEQSIANYFGVKAGVSASDRTKVEKLYYPKYTDGKLVAYKERDVPTKKFITYKEGNDSGEEFFGQWQAALTSSRTLYITEGEDDCLAVFKVIWEGQQNTKYQGINPAVVSLPDGKDSVGRTFKKQKTFISKFETVVLVFDNDEPGKAALEEATKLLPIEKVKYVELPKKDACAMLEAGLSEPLRKAVLFQQMRYKPSALVSVEDVIEEACKPPEWGMSWPWPTLTKWTYGMRPRMIIGIGAGVGIGKTNWVIKVIEHMAQVHSQGCGLFMLEQPPAETLKHLASKAAKTDFTRPDVAFEPDVLKKAVSQFSPYLTLFNHKGYRSWEDIKEAIRHMVLVDGRRVIIVDPITALVSQLSSSEANDALNKMFSDIGAMTQDLDFDFIYGAHLNPPHTGATHEEGGRVKESQFTGSKAMIKWSNYIIGLERNKQAEDPIERNTTILRLLKDREYGRSGTFPIYYDADTRDYYEISFPEQVEKYEQQQQQGRPEGRDY